MQKQNRSKYQMSLAKVISKPFVFENPEIYIENDNFRLKMTIPAKAYHIAGYAVGHVAMLWCKTLLYGLCEYNELKQPYFDYFYNS